MHGYAIIALYAYAKRRAFTVTLRIKHCAAFLCHILYWCNVRAYIGGDLVDRQRIRTENDAAAVVKAIVDGIRYCHDHHIAVSAIVQQLTLYNAVQYCTPKSSALLQ
jgi:hypothetical protein